jgi:hypothetical protein
MKNVTITLPDNLARRARIEAAKQDKSLSRFVADLLEKQCKGEDRIKLTLLREFFDRPGWPSAGGPLPKREEIYAERQDELLRRYERSRLRGRREQSEKKNTGSRVVRRSRKP